MQQDNKGMNCDAANKKAASRDDVISLWKSQNKYNGSVPPHRRSRALEQRRKCVFSTQNCSLHPHHSGWGKNRSTVVRETQRLFLYHYLLITVLFFHTNTCKPTVAPSCIFPWLDPEGKTVLSVYSHRCLSSNVKD